MTHLLNGLRIGIGFDSHPFVEGRPLYLGGVEVPFHLGLRGHSDADVLIHALCDAVLGAMGSEDLGTLFPDRDDRYRGIRSTEFVRAVVERVKAEGFSILGLDAVLIANRPKVSPFRDAIRRNLAALFGISYDRINVKGKTSEGGGDPTGGDGIAVHAVALLCKDGQS